MASRSTDTFHVNFSAFNSNSEGVTYKLHQNNTVDDIGRIWKDLSNSELPPKIEMHVKNSKLAPFSLNDASEFQAFLLTAKDHSDLCPDQPLSVILAPSGICEKDGSLFDHNNALRQQQKGNSLGHVDDGNSDSIGAQTMEFQNEQSYQESDLVPKYVSPRVYKYDERHDANDYDRELEKKHLQFVLNSFLSHKKSPPKETPAQLHHATAPSFPTIYTGFPSTTMSEISQAHSNNSMTLALYYHHMQRILQNYQLSIDFLINHIRSIQGETAASIIRSTLPQVPDIQAITSLNNDSFNEPATPEDQTDSLACRKRGYSGKKSRNRHRSSPQSVEPTKRVRSSPSETNIEYHYENALEYSRKTPEEQKDPNTHSAHASHWKHLLFAKKVCHTFIADHRNDKYDQWAAEARDIFAICNPTEYNWSYLTLSKRGDDLCKRITARVKDLLATKKEDLPQWCPTTEVLNTVIKRAEERLGQLERLAKTKREKAVQEALKEEKKLQQSQTMACAEALKFGSEANPALQNFSSPPKSRYIASITTFRSSPSPHFDSQQHEEEKQSTSKDVC